VWPFGGNNVIAPVTLEYSAMRCEVTLVGGEWIRAVENCEKIWQQVDEHSAGLEKAAAGTRGRGIIQVQPKGNKSRTQTEHDTLTCTEETITGIAETRQNVSVLVELAIKRRAEHLHIRMRALQSADTVWRGNETEKTNTRCTGALQ